MKDVNGRIQFEGREELPLTAMSIGSTAGNRTGSWKFLEPYYQNLTPPCSHECLTDMDVVGMMRLVEQGDWDLAARQVLDVNPFPSITGRLCPHPCEQPCNRKAYGGGISVQAVERQVGDHKLTADVRPDLPPTVHPLVHIVGSGPAGLSAAVALRRLGHPVIIHEAAPEAGGLLRYRIPAFRLPDEVVRAEVAWVRRLGIEIRTSEPLDRARIEALGPTILAVGFGRSRPLGIPGEDLPGVLDALPFLAGVRRGEAPMAGAHAVVIGGGSTALDAARSLRRLGTQAVVYYEGTARDMPALRQDVEEARQEGVAFEFLAAPVRVEPAAAGRLRLTFARRQPGPVDAAAGGAPSSRPGAELQVDADLVLKAPGEALDAEALPGGARVEDGRIATDEAWHTGAPDVLAAGDCAGRAGHTVSDAIRSGRLAAWAMHAELTGAAAAPARPLEDQGADATVAKFKMLNMARFQREAPHAPQTLPAERRVASFDPVQSDLGAEEAQAEAARCFKCGTCVECDVCYHLCPDMAISRKPGGGYVIDLAHCKGCGVCAQECPRAAMHLKKSL